MKISTFEVTAECATNYTGDAKVTGCDTRGEPYTLDGCTWAGSGAKPQPTPITKRCTAPSSIEGYEVTQVDMKVASFDVKATCAPNYKGNAVAKCANGGEPYTLKGCTVRS